MVSFNGKVNVCFAKKHSKSSFCYVYDATNVNITIIALPKTKQ